MQFLILTAAFLCINIASASPISRRDDYTCGVAGTQTGTDSFITTKDGGYPACSSLCFANSDCRSFAWNDTECKLYKVPSANNYQVNGPSPHFFYDRYCEMARQICGTSGYQSIFDSYWWSNSIDISACAATCKQDQGCRSYAYGNGECSLYSEPVTGNLNGLDSGSLYLFYDSACPSASSPAPTTTAQATATSSISATSSNVEVCVPRPSTSTTTALNPTSAPSEPIPTFTPNGKPICGLRGYDEIPPYRYTFDGDSYNHCIADCKADSACISFAFETDTNQCFIYDVPAAVTFRYNTDSPAYFYDASCSMA